MICVRVRVAHVQRFRPIQGELCRSKLALDVIGGIVQTIEICNFHNRTSVMHCQIVEVVFLIFHQDAKFRQLLLSAVLCLSHVYTNFRAADIPCRP